MAEAAPVVSLVASIASLVDLGLKITTRLHDFTTRTSEVPESFRSLEKRLPLLTSTLRLIQQQADAGRLSLEVSTALRSLTQSTATQLQVVEKCLFQITPPSDASRLRRAVKALQSLTKDGEIRVAVERIQQDIDFLVLHQTTQHIDVGDQILAALAQLQLGPILTSSLPPHRGHVVGNVAVHDQARVHLGDIYQVHQQPGADPLKVFGLCLTSAPLMEPDSFVGRARELEEMARALRPGEPAVEQRRVVLGGLGGMGKTQLAIAYAREHQASYTSVLWLNATSELTLTASFRSMAETLPSASSVAKLDDDEALRHAFRWLSDVRNTQWLLVYDNYDDPDQYKITKYFPTTCNGTMIITTRLPALVQGQRMRQVRVSSMEDVEESLQILQNRSRRDNVRQDPDGHRLAQRLAGLPLALATAGAYLGKTTLTFRQYLEAYEQHFNIHPRRPVNLEEYTDRTLHTTWDLTYHRLECDDPLAAKVLKLLAYFDHQEIWFDLLHAGIEDESPDWLREVAGDQIDFESTMGTLVDYCLVEARPQTRSYGMHNCVHDWTLAQLNQPRSEPLFWYVVQCVTGSVNEDDWESLAQLRYARLARHALRCASPQFTPLIHPDEISPDQLAQVVDLAEILRQQIQYSAAEQMYVRALAGKERALGPDHTSTLRTVNNLGNLYRDQGKLDRAEQMYVRALAGNERALGPDHISTLNTVHNLGNLYRDQDKLDKAEQMYVRALAGCETALGPNHTLTLDTVNNLGNLYRDQGRLDKTEQMYVRVLAGYETALGPDHTSILNTVNNLGNLYIDQGKLDKAEQMYVRALAGYETALGPNHTSTLATVNNLGNLYTDQGRLDKAEQMYVRALAGRETALGPNHTSTLVTVNNLGLLYTDQGRLDKAEQMYVRALAGYETALGPDYTSTLRTVHNLGLLRERQGRLTEAEPLYQ
ncbi:hypothetical protein LTS08_008151 [Lithohypha guttulata]|nr:hypothetical protein LTS08_008151 [Lithohypha guttulata]